MLNKRQAERGRRIFFFSVFKDDQSLSLKAEGGGSTTDSEENRRRKQR